jgi:hypothetical protein
VLAAAQVVTSQVVSVNYSDRLQKHAQLLFVILTQHASWADSWARMPGALADRQQKSPAGESGGV